MWVNIWVNRGLIIVKLEMIAVVVGIPMKLQPSKVGRHSCNHGAIISKYN